MLLGGTDVAGTGEAAERAITSQQGKLMRSRYYPRNQSWLVQPILEPTHLSPRQNGSWLDTPEQWVGRGQQADRFQFPSKADRLSMTLHTPHEWMLYRIDEIAALQVHGICGSRTDVVCFLGASAPTVDYRALRQSRSARPRRQSSPATHKLHRVFYRLRDYLGIDTCLIPRLLLRPELKYYWLRNTPGEAPSR